MLTQELLVEIHVLHRQGKSIRAIAKALQISRNSVRKYLRNIEMTPTYSKRAGRASKLDPFKTVNQGLLILSLTWVATEIRTSS